MNSLQLLLLDLVRVAETPLYSAYCCLGAQFGRRVSMAEFLGMIREAVDAGLLRLWVVDEESQTRTALDDVPPNLATSYAALGHSDARYDPLGLSLTLGPRAEFGAEADWEVDLDFERGEFRLHARHGLHHDALHQLMRYFPDVELIAEDMTLQAGTMRITGRVVVRS